jgi:integrase
MGLMVECPKCKKRNSEKAKTCAGKTKDGTTCGFALSKHSGRVWWIEYRVDGKRKRERIGPNKAAAEQRYREAKSLIAEGRFIKKSPDVKTTFKNLAQWYLDLPDVKAKRSYDRDKLSLDRLLPFFGDKLLRDITPAKVQAYQQMRLSEPSGRTPQTMTKPATINRELACFKTIFNKAIANGKAEKNPAAGVKLLKENNERDRVLTSEEYVRLLAACPLHLKPIVKVAYYTGMRQGEILALTWGEVDIKNPKKTFIHLQYEHTKTDTARDIPLAPEVVEMFKAMPRGLPNVPVFIYQGRSVGEIKRSFVTACKAAGIEDFTFHDLRHTAINNWRQACHDYFRIMAVSGHKTISVFKRYNTVTKDELMSLVDKKI